jgi:hypothetical protein
MENKNKGILIALTGKKGSGKSEIAKYLQKKYNFEIVSFATPMKEMAMQLLLASGVNALEANDAIYGKDKECDIEGFPATGRELLQFLGHETRVHIHEDIWVQCAFNKIKRIFKYSNNPKVVIDDLRYDNEAHCVKWDFDGTIVEVISLGNKEQDSHASEKGIKVDYVHYDIVNEHNGLEELHKQAEYMLEDLGAK